MSSHTAPNFCSQCGSSLSPGDAFCSQCGTAVGERPTAAAEGTTAAGQREQADLRRRVEDFAIDGWDVKRDYGDRVVMVDRRIGSLWVHALLLVTTSPVGNLLYAWYRYSLGAERVELRADGTARRSGNDRGSTRWNPKSAVGVAAGLTFAFTLALAGLVLLLVSSSLVATGIGLAFVLASVASIPLAAQFAPGVKSPTTFGRRRSTDETVVKASDAPCSACSHPVGTGVRRTFAEKRYVAGVPVETLNEGENLYCRACANGDPFTGETVGDREKSSEFA